MEKEILAVEWYGSRQLLFNDLNKPVVIAQTSPYYRMVAVCESDIIAENIAALHNQCLNQSLLIDDE